MARFVLVGHPVGHSISPAVHSAVYLAQGLPHTYEAVDCPTEVHVSRVIEQIRSGEVAGANVTVPWKRVALEMADGASAHARAIGAANVLALEGGQVVAHNTDAPALAERLRAGAPETTTAATVLGNGGAALGAVQACLSLGLLEVYVSARKWRSGEEWPRADAFRQLGAIPVSWAPCTEQGSAAGGASAGSVAAAARASQLVVQASSAGMLGVGNGQSVVEVLPWTRLNPATFIYDAVYNPPRTPILEQAEQRGIAHEGGMSMLVGQAALAIELWLGFAPDRELMTAAAQRAVFGVGS